MAREGQAMTRKLLLVIATWLLVAGAFTVVVWLGNGQAAKSYSSTARFTDQPISDEEWPEYRFNEDVNGLDPLLAALFNPTRNDRDHTSPFFIALATLGQKHGLTLKDYDPSGVADQGHAFRFDANVVVVLRGWNHCIPGDDTQTLLLLGSDGKLLDRLSCSVNARLTRMFVDHKCGFRTFSLLRPDKDGAQLVIRFIPEDGGPPSGWTHHIVCAGKTYFFSWNSEEPGSIRPIESWKKGLCRVAVRNGKFEVLFPTLDGGVANH
jgi:hypothetical protein